MALLNRLSIKQPAKLTPTTVIGDLCITDEVYEHPKISPKMSNRTWWTTGKNICLPVSRKRKKHRKNWAAYRFLPTHCDHHLKDIGVTLHLQMPADHRLRVVSSYKVGKSRNFAIKCFISNLFINGYASKDPRLPLENATRSQWAACLNLPIRIYRAKKQQLIDRAAFRHLLKLDESYLKDIGVSRENVIWASRQPLFVSASLELKKIARNRRMNRQD